MSSTKSSAPSLVRQPHMYRAGEGADPELYYVKQNRIGACEEKNEGRSAARELGCCQMAGANRTCARPAMSKDSPPVPSTCAPPRGLPKAVFADNTGKGSFGEVYRG
jgi:hypothetical protein